MLTFAAALIVAAAIIGAAYLVGPITPTTPVAPEQQAPPVDDFALHAAAALTPDDPALPGLDDEAEIATVIADAVEQLASLHLAEHQFGLPLADVDQLRHAVHLCLHRLSTRQLVTALTVELAPHAKARAAAVLASIPTHLES